MKIKVTQDYVTEYLISRTDPNGFEIDIPRRRKQLEPERKWLT